jgi:hypothetical protein
MPRCGIGGNDGWTPTPRGAGCWKALKRLVDQSHTYRSSNGMPYFSKMRRYSV